MNIATAFFILKSKFATTTIQIYVLVMRSDHTLNDLVLS